MVKVASDHLTCWSVKDKKCVKIRGTIFAQNEPYLERGHTLFGGGGGGFRSKFGKFHFFSFFFKASLS